MNPKTYRTNQWAKNKKDAIKRLERLIDYEAKHNLLEEVIAVSVDKEFTAREMLDAIENEDEYGEQLIRMFQMRQRMSGSLSLLNLVSQTNKNSRESNQSENSSSQDSDKGTSADPNLLLISPTDDPPNSHYVKCFSHPAAVKAGNVANNCRVNWSTKLLDDNSADFASVTQALQNGNINFVLHYGHGNIGRILGQKQLPVIDSTNVGYLRGKSLSTVSCASAFGLGPSAISAGARAYLGYCLPIWEPPPNQRELISIFIKIVNAPNIALLNGETFLDAFIEGIVNYLLGFLQLITLEAAAALTGDVNQAEIIFWASCGLLWDMAGFTRLGDPYAQAL